MEQFTNLPTPVKAVMATLSAGLVGIVLFLISSPTRWYLLAGLLAVLLLFALYLLILHFLRKRQAAQMGGEMAQHSTMAPRGLSDPSQRAKLDNLRQNFQRGVDKFRAAGKDIYKLPWYLVVGEPGAGKTEAIRHCNVGFPPGMQDELQGAGGTINMNWWFTNHAILLDTAGKLMFEEVAPGTTSEWREFLGLLRRSRPNCPVNGLVLVIPADSLIKDTPESIAKKASRIAQQLNTIQGVLDVRFPVFVLITKTDLINGFREFFDHVKDPHLQHQMLGWSNPSDLDEAFRPDLVEQHLQQVVSRVRRRRLGLLQDPTPRGEGEGSSSAPWSASPDAAAPGSRRLDEVDSLFSLPTSLGMLAPRLRRYLETIFVPNEWSGKPLFLRGIYFTSAMREGSALDLELAEAVGVAVDTLPEGKTWTRESAYFLRDLFLEKIFKERGLVTRASNTRSMLRRRQAILFGCGFIGLALVLTFSWLGYSLLKSSIEGEVDYWKVAQEGWRAERGVWRPIVFQDSPGSPFTFSTAKDIKVGSNSIDRATFHQELANRVKTNLDIPWVYKPWEKAVAGANAKRRAAQRIVFEAGVIKPMVDAARTLVQQSGDNWSPRSSEALTFLVRLEGMIYTRSSGLTGEDLAGVNFFKPVGGFLYGEATPNPALVGAFESTYTSGDGRGFWPPRWLSAGFGLADNRAIKDGLNGFLKAARDSQTEQEKGFDHLKKVRAELRSLREQEDKLTKLAAQSTVDPTAVTTAFGAYRTQKDAVDEAIKKAKESGKLPAALFASYTQIVDEARKQSDTAFKSLETEIKRFADRAADKDNPKEKQFTLTNDIKDKMRSEQQNIKKQAEGSFTPDELKELESLDKLFLDKTLAGDPLYFARSEAYDLAIKQLSEPAGAAAPLLGAFTRQLDQLRTGLAAAREKGERYQGAYAAELKEILRRLIEVAQTRRVEGLYERYLGEVDTLLKKQAGFPLLASSARAMTVAELKALDTSLRSARGDLPALRAGQPPAKIATAIDLLETRIQRLTSLSEALLTSDGQPATLSVNLVKVDEQRKRLGLSNDQYMSKSVGPVWRWLQVNSRRLRTESDAELAKLKVSDVGLAIDFFRGPDDKEPDITTALGGNVEWASLRMLQQPSVKRLEGGKEWEVTLTLKSKDGSVPERILLLLLRFERPLPELGDWPTAARLGL